MIVCAALIAVALADEPIYRQPARPYKPASYDEPKPEPYSAPKQDYPAAKEYEPEVPVYEPKPKYEQPPKYDRPAYPAKPYEVNYN